MMWGLGILWVLSFALLLRPFVAQKTGLETLDALDTFLRRQAILLCLLFAGKLLHPQIHLNLKQLLTN